MKHEHLIYAVPAQWRETTPAPPKPGRQCADCRRRFLLLPLDEAMLCPGCARRIDRRYRRALKVLVLGAGVLVVVQLLKALA